MTHSPLKATVCLILLLVCCGVATAADPAIEQAQKLFESYMAYEKAYDNRLGGLFDDDAVIKGVMFNRNNVGSPMPEIKGRDLKGTIAKLFPFVQDQNLSKKYGACKYTDVKYTRKADKVRIECWRYDPTEQFTGRFSMLVGKAYDGKWKIFELFTEFRPPPEEVRPRSRSFRGRGGRGMFDD